MVACGRPFDVKTAPGFVELENQEPQYDFRAMAPEGVVVGEGAVAVWHQGKAWAIGAALGRRSATEADEDAIKFCLQHCPAGAKPKILRGFRG